MSFFFNQVLASNLASFNSRGFNLLISNSLVSSNLLDSYYSAWFNFVGLNFVSFTLVGFTSVDSDSLGSDFDIKLRFANAGFFSNSPPSHLASRFFLQGPPGSLSTTDYCFNLRTRPSLLLSYFKHHYFSCQVYFADNLPVFLRNLHTNSFQSPFPQTLILQPYNLHFDNSSLPHNSQGGIFFQLSLPKFRLSSRSFALYLSKPSSLVPVPLANYICSPNESESAASDGDSHIPHFYRSFYSQNLPSFVGLLGESINFIHSSTHNLIKFNDIHIRDFTSSVHNHISNSIDMPVDMPVHSISNSIDRSIHSVSSFIDKSIHSVGSFIDKSIGSVGLSTCELSSLHHFLNLRSRIASFFGFLDSFFLIDSPFLDSLPWDSFSLQQKPFCFPSLPSHLHTSSADFSLFDKQLFLANNSFFPFGKRQSCLQSCYEEHFSLQQDLFHPFNHNCSSYKEHFPLNQEHFLLGEEHFLPSNCIFTSDTPFPSTSFHQLQLCSSFLASFFQVSTFKSNFNASFIPNLKTSFPAFLSLHLFFDNFTCSANFPHFHNFHNFFSFSHSTQLDIYHHLDKSCYCPSASLHFSHFNNSSLLSHYFSNLSNLVTQNHLTLNNYFCNSANLAIQNHLTFSDYFSNSSYLMMQNQLFSSNHFYNSYNLMLLNCVIFNYYFYNYSSNFVHLLTSNPLTLQHYSNYFVDFVPPNCLTLQNYACNFIDLVHTNNFIFNYYFYNLRYLVTHNNVTFCNYFYNLTDLLLQYNVTFCNYFRNLSSLVMYNNVFLSNLFCNLTFSKLYNNVFLSNLFCNFTYFTSLKSCSNEANLHNRPSYLSDLLAQYSVYSLHSPSFKTLLRNHTRSFYSSKSTKTPNNLNKKASSMRSHYRIKMSFEGKLPSHFAISLARNYLLEQFPNAILLASCHQNTNHTHIHVLLFARDVNGKKLHFSNSNYKKLDIGWAKIYSRVFGEHKLQQHIDKKAQSRNWKKDRAMGFDRQKPYRVSVTNRQQQQQQQLQPQFQQQFQQHNQQHNQQQHPLNAHNNHYKQLQLAHNIDHIQPFKHLQLTHDVDHMQLYTQLSSNHFGTNIELNQLHKQLYNKSFDLNFEHNQLHKQLYNKSFDLNFVQKHLHNQLYTKTFDLNFVQNHHLFNTFDNHFDKYLDFNSCRLYGLTLNDGVRFNKFDSIFVTKDPFFLAQDRPYNRPFDRTYDTVFVDKQLSVDNKLPSFIDNSIDKLPSVVDKNVVHFYNNPVPSALSMINNSPIDKDLASHRPSTNLSQLQLQQQSLIQQLQHQQQYQQNFNQNNQLQHQNHLHNFNQNLSPQHNQPHNFNQNLSPQHNLDHQPTHLNHQPLPQDLHQLQSHPLYNQTHLIPSHNLTPLSSDTYLDLIHNLDTDYNDRLNDRVIDEREINERLLSERELNESKIVDRKIVDGDINRDNIHHIDNDINNDINRDDFDEPDR